MISYNSNVGISIDSSSNSNNIYHNLFISNSIQASDRGSNNWDYLYEGNYWDDYTGLDNGANDRVPGDGIGDTKIPHPGPGYDNFPFIKPYGWLFPPIPFLKIESPLDPDGNYTILWTNNSRCDGFVLQEDTDKYFSSPTEFTSGWEGTPNFNTLTFTQKPEDTYYYRIKAYNDLLITAWSPVVNVTVDFPPNIPKNLQAEPIAAGNGLHIIWSPNDVDTIEYGLYFYNILNWELLANITHPLNYYDHYNLEDGEEYSYKICAYDSRDQTSGFSKVIHGVPIDSVPPAPPTGLKATPLSDSEIDLEWDSNSEPDLAGYMIFMHDPTTDEPDVFQNIYTQNNKKTTYKVSGLKEQINYGFKIIAFDEVPNNSTYSEIVFSTTPDETHPQPPTNLKVNYATPNSLTLSWETSTDPDVVGYFIFRSLSLTGEYEQIETNMITGLEFIDSGLAEATYYYYKVKAVDDANLTSLFSESAYGLTLIGPKPPEINNPVEDFEIDEDKIDEISINMHYLFKDVNNDPLTFRVEGSKHITVTIYQENGTVILKPEKDWNGEETLTFFASDGTTEIDWTVTITVKYKNDPPRDVKIITPENGTKIHQGETLEFQGAGYDPDSRYGDELKYRWRSSIDGNFGESENLSDVKLSSGEHIITFEIIDQYGRKASATINLDVLPKSDEKDDEEGVLANAMLIGIVIVIVIIILILLFIFLKKRKGRFVEKESEEPVLAPEVEADNGCHIG